MMTRRDVLKLISAGGTTLYLSPALPAGDGPSTRPSRDNWLTVISPVDRTLPERAPAAYFADEPARAHSILWDKPGFIKKHPIPAPTGSARVVIVGGGLSGLITAFKLRKFKPIVLEQAPRFGGNAKGQSWRGLEYSIGAAYLCEPEEDSDIHKLLSELGVLKQAKRKVEEDPVAIAGRIFDDFWAGDTVGNDAAAKRQLAKLHHYFEKVFEAEETPYPEIPLPEDDAETRKLVERLDGLTFKAHLEQVTGGKLHPHVETAMEHFCWSSFGASASEISAAAGLNFYAAEMGNILVYPAGNSSIAEKLLERLALDLPRENLRASAVVFDVKPTADGVLVAYQDADGKVVTLKADYVAMACPKFVVKKVIDDLEPERLAAIAKLRYRSYLVANVLLKKRPTRSFYDLYLLGEDKADTSNVKAATNRQRVTDVILANYAQDAADRTVLTLYRGMPYDGARAELYATDSYAKVRTAFEDQLYREILPLLNFAREDVVDLRIARWGHPLPVSAPGLIKDGVCEQLRKPFKDRVFFVEQDNWALPSFETAAGEAFTFSKIIAKKLSR